MIGIYNDDFVQFLKDKTGKPVKHTSKDIICWCPWCGKEATGPHMYISLSSPIFHCFRAGCSVKKGTVYKLVRALNGSDISNQFIDKDKITESKESLEINKRKELNYKKFIIPDISQSSNILKKNYFKNRLYDSYLDLNNYKNLILDFSSFVSLNNVHLSNKDLQLFDYLNNKFICFLSDNQSLLLFRNIEENAKMRYYKIKLQESKFLDYIKVNGAKNNNRVVLAEGPFDIFVESKFNNLNLFDNVNAYYCGMTASYGELLRSIAFHEGIYNSDVIILSDRDVNKRYYERMKNDFGHFVNSLTVYYNKLKKDFGALPMEPIKIII